MKVWCSVDFRKYEAGIHIRKVWTGGEPVTAYGEYYADAAGTLAILRDGVLGQSALLDIIFPKNIKPGECKQVTIKRWEVDDG